MSRLITLDVTNTCVKVTRTVAYHYVRKAAVYGITLSEQEVEKQFHSHYKRLWTEYPNFGVYNEEMTCRKWWDEVVKRTLISSGFNGSTEHISKELYDEFSGCSNWDIYDDVTLFLQTVKNAGCIVGVISNFDDRLDSLLTSLGLRSYFDFIISSYNERCHKPQPQIFEKALRKAGIVYHNCWHIGDHYTNDYQAATNVGINSVLLLRDQNKEPPKPGVVNVRTLPEAVDIIL